uniref:ShTK domain protein n=1 Tax=Bursaphelenchus xylophilus TaxID=6326 RepID=A0A1I7SSJ2_BURXY
MPSECNQNSKLCEDDPELSCVAIEGTYYCCAPNKKASTAKSNPDGKTKDEECKDNNETECDSVKEYCKDEDSIDMMKAECAKTCGFCGGGSNGSTKPPGCEDKMKECSIWKKYGFCETDKVKADKKKEICPQTCGLC